MLKIGYHVASSGGYKSMIEETLEVNGNTFQWFTRNPRGGKAKDIDPVDFKEFLELKRKLNMDVILAHAPYTLNACSDKEEVREFALNTFKADLEILKNIPGAMYNFHPGSHMKQGIDKGIELIADTLNKIIDKDNPTFILLETMAGKGTEVGSRFEELRKIIDSVENNDRLGVCLDTCHVHDAGYDIVNDLDSVLDEFDRIIGLERLKAIHLNDSKNPKETHKDRHEKIGLGYIGKEALISVINNRRVKELPVYLETPNDVEGYKEEIDLLQSAYEKGLLRN